jgi:hypothetical protein
MLGIHQDKHICKSTNLRSADGHILPSPLQLQNSTHVHHAMLCFHTYPEILIQYGLSLNFYKLML